MEMPMEHDMLRSEIEFFEQIRPELLAHHTGKFALIKERNLIGTYTKVEEAYADGVKRFGNVPMLIKEIRASDRPQRIPAFVHGLIRAHP